MTILGLHFHSWTPIYTKNLTKFRGRECIEEYIGNKVCKECGAVIMVNSSFSSGEYWYKLSKCEATIVKADMYTENGKLYMDEITAQNWS